MRRFFTLLVTGVLVGCWAVYLVLLESQKDFTFEVLFRPSWLWVLIPLAVALIVRAIIDRPRAEKSVPTGEQPSPWTSEPASTQTRSSSVRITVPGLTEHGRLSANLQMGTPRRHVVTWTETGAPAGRLEAGAGGKWEVFDEHGSRIDHAESATIGLAMIELASIGWHVGTKSIASAEPTIVDASLAAFGRAPQLLGVEYLEPNAGGAYGDQRYRTEAWRLTNGDCVVIVSDNGGMSLMNNSENIAQAIDARWERGGRRVTIIEDWDPPTVTGHRFVVSNRQGGHLPVKFGELDRAGIVLPRYEDSSTDLPESGFTQNVTRIDLAANRLRIPSNSKALFPARKSKVAVVIAGQYHEASWEPRIGDDRERSGVLRLPKGVLGEHVDVGGPRRIERNQGVLRIL